MNTRTQLLERIADFLARHGLSERHLGLAAVGDHRLVPRLREGKGTLGTIERAEAFMARYDLEHGKPSGEVAA